MRPSFVVITKTDTVDEESLEEIRANLPGEFCYLSAVAHQGADKFIQEIEKHLG